jgi:N-formylmaleamate deformylase
VHDQIVRYITTRGLVRRVIVGHSLGGMMALWLAETMPDLGGVIDVGAPPYLLGFADPAIAETQAVAEATAQRNRMAALAPEQVAGATRQMVSGMISRPKDLNRMVSEAAKSNVATLAAATFEGAVKDLRPDLPNIKTRVTIVVATETSLPGEPASLTMERRRRPDLRLFKAAISRRRSSFLRRSGPQ